MIGKELLYPSAVLSAHKGISPGQVPWSIGILPFFLKHLKRLGHQNLNFYC